MFRLPHGIVVFHVLQRAEVSVQIAVAGNAGNRARGTHLPPDPILAAGLLVITAGANGPRVAGV